MHASHSAKIGRAGRFVLLAVVGLLAAWCVGPVRAADDVQLPGVDSVVPPKTKDAKQDAKKDKRAEISKTVLDVTALQPGKPATAAVVFDIKPGFHAQAVDAKKFANYLVPFAVNVDPNPALEIGEPVYPAGKTVPFDEPKQLSVYEGPTVFRIPVRAKADAPPGPTKLTGTLHYQICDDHECFQPEDLSFAIDTEIVAPGTPVQPANQDLFQQAAKAGVAAPVKVAGPAYSLLGGLGLAFLVGILFNAVPCVLPVLPLKALGFYEASQHSRGRSLAFGLAFSLGVVASFAALGVVVVILGYKWGELFSNPYFSAVLAIILVVMALNMFGLFTVNLPAGMYGFSPRHDTYFGNFLFGILTAALSTPCTFGLFVSVLGWALTQPPAVGMLAICTVGLGMASPYVLLSAFPEMARKFPRTGPWAELTKQFMGFLLIGVAVFFAQQWVAKVVGGHERIWWVIYGVLVAGAVFLVARAFHYAKSRTAPTVAIIIALLLVVPTFFAAMKLTVKPYDWQEYSPQVLAQAQSGNQVVLVEFTASWCANCHTIEALYINDDAIRKDVGKYHVRMVKADLSAKTAPGWELLRDLGGEGVPLTAVYSPNLKEPILLTGFFGVDRLRDALAKAVQAPPAGGEAKTAMAQ